MPQAAATKSRSTTLADDRRAPLEAALADLATGAAAWVHLTLAQRARLLERLSATVGAVAEEWADTASTSKGLEPGHALRGEEWLSGPYATLVALDAYRATLGRLAKGESPLEGIPTEPAPGDRRRAPVFPLNAIDGMLLSGYTGEVWFEPGTTDAAARRDAGLAQLHPTATGGIGLVLGAGNVTSIP
ncbi:MAG: aldehyde dehydrogenase, partial [Microbacterium sp.]